MYYETMEAVLAKSDKTIVETPGGVVPYLPLGGGRRVPDAVPAPARGAGSCARLVHDAGRLVGGSGQ